MNEKWKHLYTEYIHWEYAEISDRRTDAIDRLRLSMVDQFRMAEASEKVALCAVLVNPGEASRRKHFIAAVLWNVAFSGDGLPEECFLPLIDAAVEETNPSVNRIYVEPCMMAFGREATVAELESRRLKAGADTGTIALIKSALYWTGFPVDGFSDFETQRDS